MKTEPDTMRFRLCSLLKCLGVRGKLRFLRTGMFFQNIPVLRSAYWLYQTLGLQVRYTASDGRGKLRSPLHPSLLPPKNANGRAGGKRTRLGRKRNRARRRRRRYAAAQRTLARRSRARGLPVRGSQGQDGRPRGGPGEPQRPRFAPPRERRGKLTSGKTNTQTPHRKGSVFGAGSGYYLCQK